MWLPIVLLFLVTCQISTSIGFYNEDNAGFRSDLRHAEFGERMRDWFRNLKDRLFGRKMESSTSEEREMINLDKAELQDRIRNSGGFFVDLSKLTFDPKYDIGFRIGRWYFIRMGDKIDNEFRYNDSNEWDTMSASLSPDQLSTDDWSNYDHDKALGTAFPSSTTDSVLLAEQTTTESDVVTESGTTEAFKHEEDNETGFNLDSGSAQVIFP
ncbi:hypothetical protein KPH14_007790 [Odynerus spinipes]|uniref:Uncharacterized protein n=1 Tax=Odynerus spinipes TaxID=1348599 RepID=A0AAD9RJ28_9HYME|nr:hypothetical protein KPH14_007790 [Odynerus spinipes]